MNRFFIFSRPHHTPTSLQRAVSFALQTIGIENINSRQDKQKIMQLIKGNNSKLIPNR